jgi:hypothetical protein
MSCRRRVSLRSPAAGHALLAVLLLLPVYAHALPLRTDPVKWFMRVALFFVIGTHKDLNVATTAICAHLLPLSAQRNIDCSNVATQMRAMPLLTL